MNEVSVGVSELREDVAELVHQLSGAERRHQRLQRSNAQTRFLLATVAA